MVAGATAGTATACRTDQSDTKTPTPDTGLYGRTPREIAHDKAVMEAEYLNEHELSTIAVLCDIILPDSEGAGSAGDAKVPDFIEFIVKDIPNHQLPMRGGLMWLDTESRRRFNLAFVDCSTAQQTEVIEDIAYPDPDNEKPEMAHGRRFFNLMRNLTITGYYTSEKGIKDLGYQGNYPNVWDGVPPEVLAKHEVDYDPEWIAKCVDQSQRDVQAEWDENGNLIS